MSKPGKVLRTLCKKLGVRLTVKRGQKRVYKSVKVLKRQCANKKKKVKKKVKRRRKFGTGLVGANNIPPTGDGVTIDNKNYHFMDETFEEFTGDFDEQITEKKYDKGDFNNGELVSGDTYVYVSHGGPDVIDNNPVYYYIFQHFKKETGHAEEEIIPERIKIHHGNENHTIDSNPAVTKFYNEISAAHLGQGLRRTVSHIGKRRKKKKLKKK
tara:strand:+ start:479 stop:1114 length:636 start_codon:yes stop_codon:yes gene_type:complete